MARPARNRGPAPRSLACPETARLVSLRPSYAAHERCGQAERQELAALLDQLGPDAPPVRRVEHRRPGAHLVIASAARCGAGIVLGPWPTTRQGAGPVRQSTPYPRLVERVRPAAAVLRLRRRTQHRDTSSPRGRAPRPRAVDAAHPRRRRDEAALVETRPPRTPAGRRAPVGVELIAPGLGKKLVKGGDQVVSVTGDPGELLLWAFGRRRRPVELSATAIGRSPARHEAGL